MFVNILGTQYTIVEKSEVDDKLLVDCDGYCDWTTKTIVIERETTGTLGDMELYIKQVKRHEIIHAFLFESGLAHATNNSDSWATNEEMVDWIASQGLKIHKAWEEADAI